MVRGGRHLVSTLDQDLLPPRLHLPRRHHPRQHRPGPLLLQAGPDSGVLLSAGLQAGGQASAELWQERQVGRPSAEVYQDKEGLNIILLKTFVVF